MARFIGIDVGAESLKIVELTQDTQDGHALRWTRRRVLEHNKNPGEALTRILTDWDWANVESAAVTGRLGRQVSLRRIPMKQAQAAGYRFLFGEVPATLVTIGSHGFQVLDLRGPGQDTLRENSRCAQGTGNFLRQLVERFDLTVEDAAELAAPVEKPAALSGRCPVILKTDMTHLANKGEDKARILAGLLDAIAENVQVLVRPRMSPERLVLAGGVARSARVRAHFARFAERQGMSLTVPDADDGLFLEALGSALDAAQHPHSVPGLRELLVASHEHRVEKLPALGLAMGRVHRMRPTPLRESEGPRDVVLGFDIGSTGSKAVAIDLEWRTPLWEGYIRTNGDPVGAAQQLYQGFLDSPCGLHRVRGLAATGSGREIVGSLLSTCYGRDAVYVLNEIAAHAAGATHLDPDVDTIFEIGGQDAKYIRLAGGRVIDAAMNEACSAGTGSFIEEQGKRFEGIENIAQLGQTALDADACVALGQHCSIFMAEIIDEAIAAGEPQDRIIAGIYDSVIANYLNRVKGSRSVGQRIFCQGMPFASDALAAAVAKQTGAEVVIPPKPGLMGAIGIALLAADELAPARDVAPIDGAKFLAARVERKDEFICNSTQGCGGSGNKCRIDRLTTLVEAKSQRFTWGGGCSLHDKGTRTKKLPDLTPDPFRARRELIEDLIKTVTERRGRPVVAMTDEFQLKGLFPFFATFIHELGFDVAVTSGADRKALKRGIEESSVPFCAPMQQFRGLVATIADGEPEWMFLPLLRELPRIGDEEHSTVCPIVQAAPDMLKWDLEMPKRTKVLTPVIDMGQGNLDAEVFKEACHELARDLGVGTGRTWEKAWRAARNAQGTFDDQLLAFGAEAMAFCETHDISPIVVLGRSYTIHNDVLNSNVPSIVRAQGAIAIPVDCLPIPESAPIFGDVFWGYSQRILRAAWTVRRTPKMYSIFCSNYSCGPDSFTVHTYAWLMEGKPFALIETDGHSGDAGTKTRVEAFLHCVHEDLYGPDAQTEAPVSEAATSASALPSVRHARLRVLHDPVELELPTETITAIVARKERLLIPAMGPEAEAVAAAVRGLGAPAEVLPTPTPASLALGRRHTSGKECLPMTLTFGSLLDRVSQKDDSDHYVFLMPGSCGPCRFGAYRGLHKMLLDRVGLGARVRIWSPPFGNYFGGLPPGFSSIVLTGLAAFGVLEEIVHDVRPAESRDGAADAIHRRYAQMLSDRISQEVAGDLSTTRVLFEAATGRAYGIPAIIEACAREMAAIKLHRDIPNVLLVGEIYVRSDPYANDYIARGLERRGLRVRLEPVVEFIQYSEHISWLHGKRSGLGDRIERWVRDRFVALCHHAAAVPLEWPEPPSIAEALAAAEPYMRKEVEVETGLTLGVPIHSYRRGDIDATVSVGPLECMPNKIAEAQFVHVRESEGLPSLSLSLNGDPIDPEVLDNFAFEIHQRFERRRGRPHRTPETTAAPSAGTEPQIAATKSGLVDLA
ncbi:MAG: CoA activase [Deltaproteobacteria bacterium]|nr:CoA activase [Deltaproteobacteria bacterium]